MKSALPKVLHRIAGLSLVGHVLKLAAGAGGEKLAVVIGPGMDNVRNEAMALAPGASVFVQHNQLGTADAVLAARELLAAHSGDVIVLFGDTPLITGATIARIRAALDGGAHVVVLGFKAADPTGYGRLLTERRRRARSDPRGEGSDGGRAGDRPVQFRRSGVPLSGPGLDSVARSAMPMPRASSISLTQSKLRARTGSRRSRWCVRRRRCSASTRATSWRLPKRSSSAGRARARWPKARR